MDDLTYTHIKPTIASAKITATPTATSWAQAYHAGHLFAVLSLSGEKTTDEEKTLAAIGKDIINSLEEEYFTLETKSLVSIKLALQTTIAKIPSEITPCLLVAAIIANPNAVEAKQKEILYVFALGSGNITLKRGDDIQPLLHDTTELTAASGFLQDNDSIILQTHSFAHLIPKEKLFTTITNHKLEDAAEMLAPLIHEAESGNASAIIVHYKSNLPDASEKTPAVAEIENVTQPTYKDIPSELQEEPKKKRASFDTQKIFTMLPHVNLKKISLTHVKLSPKKIVFIVVAVIIAIVLVSSIVGTIQKKEHEKKVSLFQSIFPQAQKKYDEGQSLIDLNTNLAHDSFQEAEKILKDGKGKFPDGSPEAKQIDELLQKTESALSSSSQTTTVEAKQVDASSSPLLEAQIKNSGTLYTAADDKKIYLLSKDAVSMIEGTTKAKVIIKNDGTWVTPAGIGAYLGNVYVLDAKASKIIKFPVTDDGYGQANYFASGVTPDLAEATGMAIDGSIFVVLKNGTIAKYTKGAADDFKISNLDRGLVNPMAIFTTIDGNNLYVLDNGHARVVVLNKSGAYQAQYQIPQAKTAKALAVDEKNKKIYLLNGGKVFEAAME